MNLKKKYGNYELHPQMKITGYENEIWDEKPTSVSRQLSEMIPFNSFKYSILLDTGAQRKIISQDENVGSSVSKYCVNVPSSFAILRESISVSNP